MIFEVNTWQVFNSVHNHMSLVFCHYGKLEYEMDSASLSSVVIHPQVVCYLPKPEFQAHFYSFTEYVVLSCRE